MSDATPISPHIEGDILIYQQDEQTRTLIIGTPAWYTWLQTATTFTFTSSKGMFTARREQAGNRRGGWYWRAYHRRAGKLHRVYLGRPEDMTPEHLNAIAARLAGQDESVAHPQIHAHHVSCAPVHIAEIARKPSSILPSPLTSLVGRDQEIEIACSLLTRLEVRELTITGTGGVGKTRLALAIAARLQDTFADGIGFISLASLHDPNLVLPTIAQAEGLPDNRIQSLEALQAALREQHRLLVLDNFETVVTAAPLLLELLTACPHLKLLVTSRERLHVRGEREFVVHPLTLPDRLAHLNPDPSNNEMLARYSAVALFLERAREIQHTLQLTPITAPLIIEICRRLDGLPLAIELAAARLKVLSLQALLERLEHRLAVLTNGPRDLPTRQQTLRKTISWSYDLLSHEEQRLFRLLAVFVNGCTLEAVEAVYSMQLQYPQSGSKQDAFVAPPPSASRSIQRKPQRPGDFAPGGERSQVLDMLTSLLDKHLLYQDKQANDAPRFLLHETIREYALEALVTNHEMEAARQAHAEYYLQLSEEAEAHLEGAQQAIWLEQLECEYANLRSALQWTLEQHAYEMTLRLSSALFRFWEGHRHSQEGRNFLERALANSQGVAAQVRARALFVAGFLAFDQGDLERGSMWGREALALYRELEDARHLGWSLFLLGYIASVAGDFMTACTYAEEGLAVVRTVNEKVILAYLLDLSGQIALEQGEDSRARALLEEGLTLHREVGDTRGSVNALSPLKRVLSAQGEVTQARTCAEEQLALSKAMGFWEGTAGALNFLGRLALEEGNIATASELFEESLAVLRAVHDSWPIATNLQGIGVTFAMQGRPAEAARLWGAAEALCAALGVPLPPGEHASMTHALPAVRAALGEEAFTIAWTEGQTMTPEQVLATVKYISRSNHQPAQATNSTCMAHQQPASLKDLTEKDLTRREMEVLRLVARGLTDAQIAEALVISPRTVNAHLRSIYAKLDITSRNAATYFALEHDLL